MPSKAITPGAMARTEPHSPEVRQLSRDDWLDAAFDAVAAGGYANLRVLTIAKGLGVTRGSFFWHFKDRNDLVAALLERWRLAQRDIDEATVGAHGADAKADLLRILDASLARGATDYKGLRFGLALRDQGRHDAVVAHLLAEMDARRRKLLEAKYLRLTADPARSAQLALVFYLAIAGAQVALGRVPSSPAVAMQIRDALASSLIEFNSPNT